MRLRTILLVLSMFATISTAAGGLYYFFSLREHAYEAASRRAMSNARMVENQLSSYLSENLNTVRAIAGLREMQTALLTLDLPALNACNDMLDHFRRALDVGVCYLMDNQGLVIASSNRYEIDSFVGQNFSFRPYFKQAIAGRAGQYMALGTTSRKRGAYYSYPVVKGPEGKVLGVVVIKAPISVLERNIIGAFDGITLLTGPADMIFSANRKDWLFKTLWPQNPQELAKLQKTRQFGEGPWEWVGLELEGRNLAVDRADRQYLVYSINLENYPTWRVVHLQGLEAVSKSMWQPLARTTGGVVLGLCIFTGLSVYFLHRKAGREIMQREAAERGLLEAKEQLSHYSKDLERQVRQRTREITGFLQYTPAVVYMKDRRGRYIMVNSRWEELFGLSSDQAMGRTVYDVFPREVADQFRQNDLKVLGEKKPYQGEELFPLSGRMYNYLSVRFPVLDEAGNVTRLCGISVDISDLKKAQDQLRRLSGSIMASQEKERTAIARELHDELGQVLTALRMDAVWLRERLGGDDLKATRHADNMCRLIDKTISDVRHIATRLRPPVLDDLGLVDALEWYTTEYEKRTGIACVFTHFNVPELSEFISIAAYRVAQEALTNVARHSGANNVDVTLRAQTGLLSVAVVDNGSGFDIKDLSEKERLGLAGMSERAGLAGGKLEIKSRPGQGTKVLLTLPLRFNPGGAA